MLGSGQAAATKEHLRWEADRLRAENKALIVSNQELCADNIALRKELESYKRDAKKA